MLNALKNVLADALNIILRQSPDKGLMLETSANTFFTVFAIYSHQLVIDTVHVQPLHQCSSTLVLTVTTSIP